MNSDRKAVPEPWTDSGQIWSAEEDAAAAAIDHILTDGGMLLWQKYLERKSFPFAAEAAINAAVGNLRMCFVSHDQGENSGEDWDLEEEPVPGVIDNWARMQLPVRKAARADDAASANAAIVARAKSATEVRRQQQSRARTSEVRPRAAPKAVARNERSESRSMPLPDEVPIDDEEERLRETKHQEESSRRDMERHQRESERAREREKEDMSKRHEEMAARRHTFDSNGEIIWIEDVKLERMPKVQEIIPYLIKKDLRQPRIDEQLNATSSPQPPASPGSAAKKTRGQRGGNNRKNSRFDRSSRLDQTDEQFTDGFSKLQNGQPPIVETMVVQTGVILESMGKKKQGPVDGADRQMSRKEYVRLAEKEVMMDRQYHHGGAEPDRQSMDGSARPPGSAPTAPTMVAGAAARGTGAGGAAQAGPAAGAGGPGGAAAGNGTAPPSNAGSTGPAGGTLPPLQNRSSLAPSGQHGLAGAGNGAASPDRTNLNGKVLKEPPSPSPATRARKFEALGHLRPPRYHVPPLGGPGGFGAAQPPLGATMGHGLIHSGSMKEAFYFPVPGAKQGSMLKSASDVSLTSARRQAAGGYQPPVGRSSKPGSRERDLLTGDRGEDDQGRLRPEMSNAYRSFMLAVAPPGNDGGHGRP